ncbi:hypothetical protein SJAV_13970 [Sulfurisphaera javensis]|uniref:Uncharacterized protein n=1 Tax=Sulfurisphaera javensis TaxID=2049879 RepID=A0AAT9GRD0_9CREN
MPSLRLRKEFVISLMSGMSIGISLAIEPLLALGFFGDFLFSVYLVTAKKKRAKEHE